MKNTLKLVLLLNLFFFFSELKSQDFIYKTDGTKIECSVQGIDSDGISYTVSNKTGKIQSLNVLQASLIIFSNGQYVTIPTSNEKLEQARNSKSVKNDIVITRFAEMIEGNIIDLSKNGIEIVSISSTSASSIKGDEAILTIYKNGDHVFFKNPAEVAALLEYMQPQLIKLAESSAAYQESSVKPVGRPAHLSSESEENSPVSSPKAEKSPALNSKEEKSGTAPTLNTKTAPDELTDVDFDEFSDKALQKIEDFTKYLGIIGSKETFPESANQAIDLAIELFVDENVLVEVSTTGYNQVLKRKIRDYLTRLKLLKYDKVEIQWADINYVSNFRKGPDGNYYGSITVKQTFKGYKDNQVVYSDVTKKDVEVVIKGMEKSNQGQKEMVWDVLLSDIGVQDTK